MVKKEIENNGWIKFNPKVKLPKDTFNQIVTNEGKVTVVNSNVINEISRASLMKVYWYKPIELDKPPTP